LAGYRRSHQNEIAADIDIHNTADERKQEQQLVGFRAVSVLDRLSRNLWPSLCAADGCSRVTFRKLPSIADTESARSSSVCAT
jgi:hypothetical protein